LVYTGLTRICRLGLHGNSDSSGNPRKQINHESTKGRKHEKYL